MAHQDIFVAARPTPALPVVRRIGPADLKEALIKGFEDFAAIPSHAVFLSLIYPVIGLFLGRLTFGLEVVPLLFPLAAGFALIGPFAAVGLYELSRQREEDHAVSWRDAFDVWHSPSFGAIAALGLLLTALFLVWVAVANALYIAYFGYGGPQSVGQFMRDIFTTRSGWSLIVVGNAVGFLFAVAALLISAVSFPLLLDRPVGAAAAALTSVRVVLENPVTMALWGLIVAGLLVLGSLPLFLGLAVVMPVLGHSSWHLYRKAVEPDPNATHERAHPEPRRRYAADFPVSLFMPTDDERPRQ